MSHAWWTGTEESFAGNKIVINVNNKNYIPYDLGQSMLMLPGDWLGEQLGRGIKDELKRQHFREAIVSFLIFIPLNLLAILTCFRFLKLLKYSEKIAGLSSLIWSIATSVLFYSNFHQQNNQILLFVLVSYQMALAYAIERKKVLAILSGAALGFAFTIRITNILYMVGVLIFLIGSILNREKKNAIAQIWRSLLWWVGGFAPFVLLERVLNYARYGSWTITSASLHLQIYAKADTLIEPNGVVAGTTNGFPFVKLLSRVNFDALLAPFFSPEKSIFLYDPLALPCLILMVLCWNFIPQDTKCYLKATIIVFLLHVYIYSWTKGWMYHPEWGARYHITSIHLLLIPLIPLLVKGAIEQIDRSKKTIEKILVWIARSTIILAVLIQFSAIAIDGTVEAYQQQLNTGSKFRLAQRFKNISTLLSDSSKSNFDFIEVGSDPTKADKLREQFEINPGWNILPSIYKYKLEADYASNRLVLLSIWLWSIIFVAAGTSTIWIFVK